MKLTPQEAGKVITARKKAELEERHDQPAGRVKGNRKSSKSPAESRPSDWALKEKGKNKTNLIDWMEVIMNTPRAEHWSEKAVLRCTCGKETPFKRLSTTVQCECGKRYIIFLDEGLFEIVATEAIVI